jgi:hypothetical protein
MEKLFAFVTLAGGAGAAVGYGLPWFIAKSEGTTFRQNWSRQTIKWRKVSIGSLVVFVGGWVLMAVIMNVSENRDQREQAALQAKLETQPVNAAWFTCMGDKSMGDSRYHLAFKTAHTWKEAKEATHIFCQTKGYPYSLDFSPQTSS